MTRSNLALERENAELRKQLEHAFRFVALLKASWLGRLVVRRAANRVKREVAGARR